MRDKSTLRTSMEDALSSTCSMHLSWQVAKP
jgi:hypothetical protein